MNPRLTIQLLGWNGAQHLRETLTTLSEIPQDQVILRYIDNGSEDYSIEIVRDLLPIAEIIALQKNTGFAHAHNIGFSKCTTPYVLTLDQDIVIIWDGIKKLLDALDQDKYLGAVQGKLYRKGRGRTIDSAGIIQTLSLNGQERGSNEEDRGQYDVPASLIAITGGCGLYRIKALKSVIPSQAGIQATTWIPDRACLPHRQVGNDNEASEVFDKDFFTYKEDVDLGWRMHAAGWGVKYIPVLVGYHARTLGRRGIFNWGITPNAITSRITSTRTKLSLRNYIWMLAKNMTWQQEIIHAPFILARLAVFFVLSLFSPQLFAAWGDTLRGIPSILIKRQEAK